MADDIQPKAHGNIAAYNRYEMHAGIDRRWTACRVWTSGAAARFHLLCYRQDTANTIADVTDAVRRSSYHLPNIGIVWRISADQTCKVSSNIFMEI
jgi:hypothetical protein